MTEMLVGWGVFIFAVLYWVYYVTIVRRTPRPLSWYDSSLSIPAL